MSLKAIYQWIIWYNFNLKMASRFEQDAYSPI